MTSLAQEDGQYQAKLSRAEDLMRQWVLEDLGLDDNVIDLRDRKSVDAR